MLRARFSGADAVTSASVVIAQPSGNYLICLNTAKHSAENLRLWTQLFTEPEAPVIFEDISCLTARSDIGGQTMADSFRSRLPENQMKVQAIDGTLLLSKADAGLFDLVILSQEAAEAYGAESLAEQDGVLLLRVKGGAA